MWFPSVSGLIEYCPRVVSSRKELRAKSGGLKVEDRGLLPILDLSSILYPRSLTSPFALSQNLPLVADAACNPLAIQVLEQRNRVLPGQPTGDLLEHRDIDLRIRVLARQDARLQIVDGIDMKHKVADANQATLRSKKVIELSSKLDLCPGGGGCLLQRSSLQARCLEGGFQSLFGGLVRTGQRGPVRRQSERIPLGRNLSFLYKPRDDRAENFRPHLAEYAVANFFAAQPQRKRLATMMVVEHFRDTARQRAIALSRNQHKRRSGYFQ